MIVARSLAEDAGKPWSDVVLASFIVWLTTFFGLVLGAVTRCFTSIRKNHVMYRLVIPSFATGALLATCVFLLIPESLELLAGGHEDHGNEHSAEAELETVNGTAAVEDVHHDDEHRHFLLARFLQEEEAAHADGEVHSENSFAWKFGASLLGGFLFPILLHALFPSPSERCDECQRDEAGEQVDAEERVHLDAGSAFAAKAPPAVQDSKVLGGGESFEEVDVDATNSVGSACVTCPRDQQQESVVAKAGGVEQPRGHSLVDMPLVLSILLGDFLHNFTDGIFIGTAFLLCSRDIGWTLVATTIYHELAQELADFVVLTSHCGLPVWKAVVANAVSGLSVLVGGLVVLATEPSNTAIGAILAVSAGVYVYITACECIPKIKSEQVSAKETLLFVLFFALGAIPIGLVLLNHGHCEGAHEEGEDHAEDSAADLHNETGRWLL
jgi:zinc transporter ZupT